MEKSKTDNTKYTNRKHQIQQLKLKQTSAKMKNQITKLRKHTN